MLEIEELLNERKDYMRETCPAYRLVCAEHEALVEILGSWPGISEAFRSYEAYRHMVAAIAQPATKRIKSSPISLPRASLPMERTTSPRKKFWLPPRQRTRRSGRHFVC